jgi:D-serine deaminase-like pyridoxal phosphate-dependent protein
VAWLARRAPVVDGVVRAAERDARVFRTLVELGLGDGRLDARTLTRVAGAVAGSAGRHFRSRL